jgi:tetratricopeptide (TPR) repeat protein
VRKIACAECAADVVFGETFRVADKSPLCESCANGALQRLGLKNVPEGTVARNVDPTVCGRCGADWGTAELARVGSTPLCATCTAHVRNFPFPQWVKVSFAVLMIVVVADAILNARYIFALRELKQGARMAQAGNADGAADRFEAAARHVKGEREIQLAAVTFRGISLLNHDRSAEAEKVLQKERPEGKNELYENALLMAHIGAAFDRHDYDAFLAHSQQSLEKSPKSARALATVASAYACKYAVSGTAELRTASLDYLDRARAAEEKDLDFPEYEARIRHRLDSREIINAAEYHRRFGKGAR